MEIDEFVEQDVLAFFDALASTKQPVAAKKQSESSAFFSRDYEKELLSALDANDVTKAKRVLHDLKAKFDETPSGTQDKAQLKLLLSDLYEKFKDHLDEQNTFGKIDSELERIAKPGAAPVVAPKLAPDDVPPPPVAARRVEPVAPVKAAPAAPIVAAPAPVTKSMPNEHEVLVQHARELLDAVERHLANARIKAAASAYRVARMQALAMDGAVPNDIIDRFLSLHERIAQQLRPEPKTTTAQTLDKELLAQIEREKHDMDALLQKHDLAGVMASYKRMRMLAQQLTDAKTAEAAAQKLVRIYTIITQLRQSMGNDRKLARSLP